MIVRPSAEEYQARLELAYEPTDYQVAIFHWIEFGRGHRVVRAVAGAGKTTTIIAAAKLITGTGLFVAFNKAIAEMLATKLEGTPMTASTMHAHGNAAIRYAMGRGFKPNDKKYREMVDAAAEKMEARGILLGQQLTKAQRLLVKDGGFPARTCDKLIGFARMDLLGWLGLERPTEIEKLTDTRTSWERWADNLYTQRFEDQLMDLADRHGLNQHDGELDPLIIQVVRECMIRGSERVDSIDFTDMLWLPVVKGFKPKQYAWVFVDEAQDTSAAALELLSMSRRPGGRMLLVGDPKQAINAFAGADNQAFSKIVQRTRAEPLPLSICWRCPTSVLALAREYCPEIEARPGAPVGRVTTPRRGEYVATAQEGDLVLCRKNAPLVGLWFELVAEGLAAVIKGRDMVSQLAGIVRKAGRRGSWEDFGSGLTAWSEKQVAAARKRFDDEDKLADRIELIADQEECVRVIWARSTATSVRELCQAISDIFDDNERGNVTLSSIHKAKGLEAKRVAILEPQLLAKPAGHPEADELYSKRKRQPQEWEKNQDRHVAYVAYTRASEELMLIQEAA